MKSLFLPSAVFLVLLIMAPDSALPEQGQLPMNLLMNPTFEFHTYTNHRLGRRESFQSHNTAFWNTDAWGDITVIRESHAPAAVRPPGSVHNLVSIRPGKKLWQFFTLPEAGLAHGDFVSLHVSGFQRAPRALVARTQLMKLDSEDGTWVPSDYGHPDKRTFPKHARGELVVARTYETKSEKTGAVELMISGAEVLGHFTPGNESHSTDINTIGIRVEFENVGDRGEAWVAAPTFVKGKTARQTTFVARPMKPLYRHVPRTIQKLWKGGPIHIIVMGSSIDRGSANPSLTLYDENPDSPTYKQPLSAREFEADKIGRPELAPYFGWWQHYFDYAGRLKLELMRKYNLGPDKICLNFMARDGSCVGEAHSGLKEYCSLSLPPDPNTNGHASGKTWEELYPGLFERPEGPRPDLVIFGSGANEKTDTPDEVAVFEGAIRWIQRHYPETEFLFCQFQNFGSYTANIGDLEALALRYQIPIADYEKISDDLVRWCNRYAYVPRDGHPQAAAHYVWFKQLEKAFECWSPIETGQAQLPLPERVHPNSYGWEGEMVTFDEKSPRIRGNLFIFEDTAINCWGSVDEEPPIPYIDGKRQAARRSFPRRDIRNSLFRFGRARLGDRHILELAGKGAKLTAVDAKVCPNRQFFGMDSPQWDLGGAKTADFKSDWGFPFGKRQVRLEPGQAISLEAVFTDLSVAWVDARAGGELKVLVDGRLRLEQPANVPFKDRAGKSYFIENRKGILGLPFGLHTVQIESARKPVPVLGIFAYDSRSNRAGERRLTGLAAPGETVTFSAPFRARPLVLCHGGLQVEVKSITPEKATFIGNGPGTYEIIGE